MKTVTKTCDVCGKQFTTKDRRGKTCSTACGMTKSRSWVQFIHRHKDRLMTEALKERDLGWKLEE